MKTTWPLEYPFDRNPLWWSRNAIHACEEKWNTTDSYRTGAPFIHGPFSTLSLIYCCIFFCVLSLYEGLLLHYFHALHHTFFFLSLTIHLCISFSLIFSCYFYKMRQISSSPTLTDHLQVNRTTLHNKTISQHYKTKYGSYQQCTCSDT